MLDLKARGLSVAPKLAIGDGAMGFWGALEEVWPQTAMQRCWVHKTANILNKPWMAENKEEADQALDLFLEKYQIKYPKAARCLAKDRDELLAFYNFPAEHWKHIRTTNPIESTFATVRHRTKRSKGCLSRDTALIMVFKLIKNAENRWRRLHGRNQLPKVIEGVRLSDGCEIITNDERAVA